MRAAITSQVIAGGHCGRYHSVVDPGSRRPQTPAAPVGVLLRRWRGIRRASQLGLASLAGVSSRHLSFIETGRAQPSREMVARLAEALEIPLRERNALFLAAGYAPAYSETRLAAPGMERARQAIEFILRQQEPYPAFVLSRHWELLQVNAGAKRFFNYLRGGARTHSNILREVFDPKALRPLVVNWDEVAGDLIRHLHNEVAAAPSDTKAAALLEEMLAYPGVPSAWRNSDFHQPSTPLLTAVYRKGEQELRFFSTITTFGTPQDVTLDELRIECSFPADEGTERICRELAAGA